MNAKLWPGALIGLIFVLFIDGALALVLSFMAMAENCDNVPPPQVLACSESFHDLLVAALFAVPALYVVLLALAVKRVQERQRRAKS